MTYSSVCLALVLAMAFGCSGDVGKSAKGKPEDPSDQARAESREIVNQSLSGKAPEDSPEGTEECAIFDRGLVAEVFRVDPSVIKYRRSIPSKTAGHVVCRAYWDKPDKEAMEKAYREAMMNWTMNRAKGEEAAQPKYPNPQSEVSLTLTNNDFSSSQEAVSALEGNVQRLTQGVTVTVGGKERTTRMEFGDWVEGVGDRAIFTSKGAFMVANDARLITVSASVTGDEALDREKTIELTQALLERL